MMCGQYSWNARRCHPDCQNSFRFHLGNRAEVFIWQNFQPAYRHPGNRAIPPSYMTHHIENFTMDLEVRRDLGDQAYVKRPLISLFIAQNNVHLSYTTLTWR